MRAVDAIALRAQHQIVARGTPGGLLDDLDVGHAVLGEDALLLGNEQRRGIRQSDVAELGALHLRSRGLRDMHAAEKARFGGGDRGRRAAVVFRNVRRLKEAVPEFPSCSCWSFHSSSFCSWVDLDRSLRCVPRRRKQKNARSEVAHASSRKRRCFVAARL